MRIGIDARFFGPKAKGLGRYTQKLIEGLELIDNQNDYVIFLRRENFDEYRPQNLRFKKALADYRWYSLVEQLFFPFNLYRHKIDLMHFTHFNAPVLYFKPYVVTIHDLILQRFPTAKGAWLGRLKYFLKNIGYKIIIRLVISKAKKIIAISRFVKDDIIKSFGVSPEKMAVIYEGAPARSALACEAGEPILAISTEHLANSEEVLDKYGIKKSYLLYVGNAYPQKNLARLIEAFKLLRLGQYSDLQLVLIGGDDYFYKKIKKENCDNAGVCFGGGVIFTGFVPDEDLRDLYANASLYVFPSLCEGFGLPPLEAMACGVPVVSSGATCLPEILGEAAYYFDAENSADITAKISEVLSDNNLRAKLVARGFEQIKKYSWRKMALETQKVYAILDQ